MKKITAFFCGVMTVCSMGVGSSLVAQSKSSEAATVKVGQEMVSALLLSDIHFDPFHDPDKARRLADAPVSEWNAIFAGPPSTDQATAFAALQKRCNARGMDSSYDLLQSSLGAARTKAADARFITVSGDLIAHGFGCRYAAVVPGKTQSDYAAFVEKTVDYVMGTLRGAFPGVPLYTALGNNDSDCGDYRLDGGSGFLVSAGKSVIAGLPRSVDRKQVLADFEAGGYYSVIMAAPMRHTRLIVLNDIFMSNKYETCGGKPDTAMAAAQYAWLQKQLAEARQQKQGVWVMGHIPPAVDIYATLSKMRNVCGGDVAQMFLSSDKLGEVLAENADVVRLGIFAHTHMDELRLVGQEGGAPGGKVAIKMVSSISPVDGNNPSFTVAQVDAASATLVDYKVFAASNQTGVDTSWSKEYDYAQTYHEPEFSPTALDKMIGQFQADPGAETAESKAYIDNFVVGDKSSLIKPLWPQYVCALSHYTAKGFAACVCPAQ